MIREVFLFFEVISISKLLTDVTDSDTITLIFRYRTKRRQNGQNVRGLPSSTDSFVEWAYFSKLLSKEPDAQYRSEQGKILTVLWQNEDGRATATDIALASGLANNTLTSMIKKLVDQGLVTIEQSDQDKRKKFVVLTELGWAQKEIGDRVSEELGEIFYQGFSDHEIREFEAYQERIITNLKAKENDM